MLRPLATVAPSVGHPVLFSAIQRGPVTSRSEQNVSSCRLVFFYSRRFHFVLQKNFKIAAQYKFALVYLESRQILSESATM